MSAWMPKSAALFAVWLVLSASYDLSNVALGLLIALAVTWLNPVDPSSAFGNVPWLRVLGYLPWLFVRIMLSGIHVTRLILSPALPIAPKLIRYRTDLQSDGAIVTLGNSLTLTPGTITVEVGSNELIVHAIDDASGRDLIERRFERKIDQLFRQGKTEK